MEQALHTPIRTHETFLYFRTEDMPDDTPKAAQLRKDNPKEFLLYLRATYGKYWLYETEGSKDDCAWIRRQRKENYSEYDYYDYLDYKAEKESNEIIAAEEKKAAEMLELFNTGKISREDYLNWKHEVYCEQMIDFDDLGAKYMRNVRGK